MTTPILDVEVAAHDKDGWIQTYKDYLLLGNQPANRNEARVLRMKVSKFIMIDDVLLKKSASGLLQRFLTSNEADKVLRDLHERECGNHTGGKICH